ncbi:site-specific DNA-methyltransferase [Bacteroides fragilis]|jgi:adenine-specific DNA-methyltransferase|uniref:site-specific DNA-methyltransferase n=1 Tax=Bacteroides fragilis TaxID=817 RepID=UPI001C73906C|nr:site-specific DNA-methyltransferase [Bacteroides fragilis]
MEKMKMQSPDATVGNVAKIAALFPQCVTERIGKDGHPELAVDFDKLREELSADALESGEERYQFTWPDKKASGRLANTPTTMTLRPCPEESVNFDNTQNLYIEGDNLEVLKILRENYLGAVKMIYIDPPYNTGNDFVYNDDFAQGRDEYEAGNGAFDAEGNQMLDPMQRNTEANGRFHTDWLNMIYPRLKVARELLSDDGVIFISIDDNEVENLKKICNEVFGESNFLTCITRSTGTPTGGGFDGLVNELDYILVYSKKSQFATINGLPMSEDDSAIYDQTDNKGRYLTRSLRRTGGEDRREDRPTMYYGLKAPDGTIVFPKGPTGYDSRWICGEPKYKELEANGLIEWKQNREEKWVPYQKFYLENRIKAPGNLWTDVEGNKKATRDIRTIFDSDKVFDFPKPIGVLAKIITIGAESDSIILDFFSGSATTAHAVMKLNAEDGGHRKFIMVQLPEVTDEKSEARKAGYANICEIGKERIRRAGKKVKEEAGLQGQDLDIGFRVLKLDSSNMEDVYYTPDDLTEQTLFNSVDNVKPDRTPLDLLFQVLPELNIELSARIEEKEVHGKKVFMVNGDQLIATFDTDVNESTITEIAKLRPIYFVMRDASAENDNVLDNFEQIFKHYSPDTIRRIL